MMIQLARPRVVGVSSWHEKRRAPRADCGVGGMWRQNVFLVADGGPYNELPSNNPAGKPGSNGAIADSLCEARISRGPAEARRCDVIVLGRQERSRGKCESNR